MTLETAAASTSTGSLVGRVIDGRYRLEEELGGGAAGTTHRARRTEDSRLVVLKLFDEDVSGDAVRRSRFEWEAATLAGLAHPNVVPILDYGVFAGRRYMVSEWLDGESLAQRMRRTQLPLTAAVGIIRQVLAALASVHSARLAHRNLKPNDVYLEWRKQGRERVKLLDFAPVMRPRSVTTGRGSYVPPELAAGEVLDARSDVYAVGALLSGLLHGGPPDVPALAGPAAAGARKGPVVDSTLQGWIRRAMARDRQERFADAAEMLQQLIDLLPRDLRSPPEGLEASRVSSVSIPSPVRTDTRRNEPQRPEASRSQVMRAESYSTSSAGTSEPRVEEPARVERVEQDSLDRGKPIASPAKDGVSPETRAAFARSERARAFIEGRAKVRARNTTPLDQLSLPAVLPKSTRPSFVTESPRAETTSTGWVVAERAKPEASADTNPDFERDSERPTSRAEAALGVAIGEPSLVTAVGETAAPQFEVAVDLPDPIEPVDALQLSAPERTVAEREAAALVAAADSIAYEVDVPSSVANESAPVSLTPVPAPTSELFSHEALVRSEAAESWAAQPVAAPAAIAFSPAADTTASLALEPHSAKPFAATVRPRAGVVATHAARPPNRKARREAARLAAMQESMVKASVEAEPVKLAKPDATPTKAQRVVRVEPRTKDQGSIRDAVVNSLSRKVSRLARNANLSPALGRGSLIGVGVVCVLAISVVSFRSLGSGDRAGMGGGTIQTAVDSTSSPLVIPHDRLGAEANSGRPETTLDPATAPVGVDRAEQPDMAAAESGKNDRVPAIDPWKDDPLPPELEGVPALVDKGDPGDEGVLNRLRQYSRYSEGDARGLLLIGRFYMNRYWRTDALAQYQAAIDRDPAVRGAPEIMSALLDLIVTGKAADEAEAFILRVYGREALPAIEAELEKLQRPMSIQRLSAVRTKLLDK